MKYILAILLFLVFATGCDIELGHDDHDHDGDGVQDHAPEDHLLIEEISTSEIVALNLTINDEFKAEALYQKVLDKFGEVRPFSNIINAEKKHSSTLAEIYYKYDLDLPENNWYDKVPEYNSIKEACEAGVKAELENIALYDELFSKVDNDDIIVVFTYLRDASKNNHLPAFERCVARN